MSRPSNSGQDRQLGEIALVGLCLVAVGLLAVTLVGSGGTIADDRPDEINAAEQVHGMERPGLIGGGSLGGAERNPIGTGLTNETNPFTSRSDELQFRITADQPAYWRVDAYDAYENGTWVRTGDYERYEPPLEATGPVSTEQTVSVSTEQDAAVLPTAWQPAAVDGPNESTLAVSAETGIHTTTYPAGSEYELTTYQYDPDPRALLVSRGNYPETIEQRYATPPDELDTRILELSDEITEGAATPVQAVCRVDDWIETNKQYDRQQTHEAGTEPLEQYLFEMDSGNAEYAASSMVVLLRAQGIPARYVTGYTPGESVDGAQYLVREVNAHAWVEVYVTGHGWVQFDPTPTADRLNVEQQAAADGEMTAGSLPADCAVETDLDLESDGEFGSSERQTDEDDADSTPDDETDSGFDDLPSAPEGTNVTVRTDPDPVVSGGTTTATVLLDGEPLAGGELSIDGESVGSTDENGTLEFTVPSSIDAGIVALIVQTDEFESGQLIDVVTFELTAEPQRQIGLPGSTVTITATAGDRPVSDVEIRDGDGVVGTTDEDGEAAIPVSLAPQTTVDATYLGATTSTQLENRLVGIVLRGLGVLAIVGLVGAVLNREYDLRAIVRSRATQTTQWGSRLFQQTVEGLRQLPAVLQAARNRGLWGSLLAASQLPAVVARRLRSRLPDSVLAYLVALLVKLYRLIVRGRRQGTPASSSQTATASSSQSSTARSSATETAAVSSIRAVWQTFVRLVVQRLSPTQTPGDIARIAIDKGFPREPVVRLTDAFRAAAYGPSRSETLTDEAKHALETLESASTVEQRGDRPSTEENK